MRRTSSRRLQPIAVGAPRRPSSCCRPRRPPWEPGTAWIEGSRHRVYTALLERRTTDGVGDGPKRRLWEQRSVLPLFDQSTSRNVKLSVTRDGSTAYIVLNWVDGNASPYSVVEVHEVSLSAACDATAPATTEPIARIRRYSWGHFRGLTSVSLDDSALSVVIRDGRVTHECRFDLATRQWIEFEADEEMRRSAAVPRRDHRTVEMMGAEHGVRLDPLSGR